MAARYGNVPCPNKSRCGSKTHKPGSGPLRFCTMLAERESLYSASRVAPAPGAIVLERDCEQRGTVVQNVHAKGTLKVSGRGGVARNCHSEGMLTISSGATAEDISSDFYTILRDSGDVHFSAKVPGQVIIATTTRGYGNTPAVMYNGSIDRDPATTFLWDSTTKEWEGRRFGDQTPFLRFIQPWREYNRLDREDPMWVSADNAAAINYAADSDGRGKVDETSLVAALVMFPNPEH